MIVETLEMENFGPFYGLAEIQLGGGGRPVVIVHGDNMSGKTSILNAIRWALYGVAKDRLGNPMPTRQLINRDAYDEGQYRVSVRLHITQKTSKGQSKFILRRQKRARKADREPTSEEQFEEYLDIDHDGNVVHASEFSEIVAELLPEGIARFFLFDGELLDEYEELVGEGGEKGAAAVKHSIEMILGVPAVTKGRDDFALLEAEVAKKLRGEAKHDEASREATESAERLEAERTDLKDDLKVLNAQRKEVGVELASVEDILSASVSLREDAGALRELRQRVKDLEEDAATKREKRREKVRELWRDALAPTIEYHVARLSRERDATYQKLGKLREIVTRLAGLERGGLRDTCPQCGQKLPSETLKKLRAEQQSLRAEAEDLRGEADEERLNDLTAVAARLRDIAPANVAEIIASIEDDLRRNAASAYKAQQEIKALEERLRDEDPDKALLYEQKRKQYLHLAEELKTKINALGEEIAAKDREIDQATRIIQQHKVPALRTLSCELDLVKDVEKVFVESVDDLIRELRERVQVEASSVFEQLTTDETYDGLRINEHYGLTIVDGKGRDVEVRSAGAEQVVALSLIGALNRLAVKRGPVIMDTPFGRLDVKHRANILKFIPTLADQVVLLVHEGEVDRKRDLDPIASRIARKYEILHPTSSRSEILSA